MRSSRRFALAACAVVLTALSVQQVRSQQRWQWPERAKNLKVLEPDTSPEKLRQIMLGFCNALGVRCNHCHVGEPRADLSTYDFASDEKAAKSTARAMYTMLGDINEHLEKVEPSGVKRVNMWCHTCHRGQPRPVSLYEDLGEVQAASGSDSTVARYRFLRERFYGRGGYDFGTEEVLNSLGYEQLGKGLVDDAINLFALNTEHFPGSANAWDSLAEAHRKAGHRDLALEYYRKSLELDPENHNAAEMLKEMEAEQE
jgi:tetratricopeptide (TPR) repeat protein